MEQLLGKWHGNFSKKLNRIIIESSNSTSKIIESNDLQRCLYTSAHSSIIMIAKDSREAAARTEVFEKLPSL
jgi:hypothetical protein